MSEHFSFMELTDSTSHPELVGQNMIDARGYEKQLKYTAYTLEEIRRVLGVPMKITSGFRNNALNKAVGGSPTSGHAKGLCADFKPIGMSVEDAYDLIMMNKSKCPSLKKCIFESIKGAKWLHIETKTEANQPTQFYTTTDGKNYIEDKG
ncbi:MAG: D-Ala-D-Ala carboxypeptidase family metallohydrolase [Desulfuromonadaceae bacterium]|nr:D-Ala-D-Ala carboxypeptidase family metallohydrolase [Desulfuromonadaceae bacterium]